MMAFGHVQVLRGIAIVAGFVAWAVLAHFGSSSALDADLGAAVGAAPIVALTAVLLWRVRQPYGIAAGVLLTVALLTWLWPLLTQHVAVIYLIQHVGTNLMLAAVFGRTLFGGGDALVTRFARMAHSPLSALEIAYSRRVTVAWTIFFCADAALSLLLFLLGSPAVWSLFANVLGGPLLIAMFLAEFAVRCHVLPPHERTTIADSIRGYRKAMRQRSSPVPLD